MNGTDFSRQFFKEMVGNYLETTFSKVLPQLISEAVKERFIYRSGFHFD
jgi:hypothetical protein